MRLSALSRMLTGFERAEPVAKNIGERREDRRAIKQVAVPTPTKASWGNCGNVRSRRRVSTAFDA